MTLEARIAFIVLFFATWCFLGLLGWAAVAVLRRGRGAVLALPLALAGACAAGVLVPAFGARDVTGFFVSLLTATAGGIVCSLAGIRLADRMGVSPPAPEEAARPERERTGPRT
jgi:uncharacterized membrane protein YeaQ/YmgE (transglycosylase-associated protein family)